MFTYITRVVVTTDWTNVEGKEPMQIGKELLIFVVSVLTYLISIFIIIFFRVFNQNSRLFSFSIFYSTPLRMFDSQNNNRGGYNVGSLYYYPGSIMNIEWTNQHSCGEANANCELVLQYMCSPTLRDGTVTKWVILTFIRCSFDVFKASINVQITFKTSETFV